MENKEIALALETIAGLLALRKEEPSKIMAYERAARALELLPERLLSGIPGVGQAIEQKIGELVETGRLPYLEQMLEETPASLIELLRVPGLGPARVRTVWQQAGIDSLDKLEVACATGGLAGIKGFGPKTIEQMTAGIEKLRRYAERALLASAQPVAERLAELVADCAGVSRCCVAGSVRRGCETVEGIELVAAAHDPGAVDLSGLPLVRAVVERGPSRIVLELAGGLRAAVHVVPPGQFACALLERTGSAAHVERLRERGLGTLEAADEAELYAALGLPCIPPELREDTGEIEAAESGALPELVRTGQLRGTFHCHTVASDGLGTLQQMADAARALGWEYLGISDHSRTSAYAGGLSVEALEAQMAEIDAINAAATDGFRLLKGSEVDILPDGSLDYPDPLLARLDFVVASIHSHFSMPLEQMTERVLAAVRHPLVSFLAHPTGRLLNKRDPYQIDLPRVIEAAAQHGARLEINSSPRRLDLDAPHARLAGRLGVPISINPDAHQPLALRDVALGLVTARRAWLSPAQVLNTRPWAEIEPIFRARRGE